MGGPRTFIDLWIWNLAWRLVLPKGMRMPKIKGQIDFVLKRAIVLNFFLPIFHWFFRFLKMVKRCGTSNMLHSKSKNATSPQLPIAMQCLCHNSVLWRLFLHIWCKSYKWIFIYWIRLTLSWVSFIVTAVTAHAEILQVKKEWQMCIVEWFWSLGKATWMEMGLSLDRKWCDYSFLFKFESSMKCFYIRRFFYSTWLSFHLSLDFFFQRVGVWLHL